MSSTGRRVLQVLGIVVAVLVVIQLVPYGRDHKNPPVSKEPAWDRPETRALAVRACFDCHSNETHWPWYASVAPASWLVQHDVEEGRSDLNFSEWNRAYEEADEAPKTVLDGSMPPWTHRLVHREARLSWDEKKALARGLEATLGTTR